MTNSIFSALIFGFILITILMSFVIYFIVLYRKKQEGFRIERYNFKQELLKTEIEIKEATLTTISRELHDNLGQVAALIKINLHLISEKIEPADKIKINESKALLSEMIQDIKSISTALKGENIQRIGLSKMICNDIARMNKLPTLEVKSINLNKLPKLVAENEVFLYRMVQEILTNILKHAMATNISVEFKNFKAKNALIISDNGKGFLVDFKDEKNSTKGNGLMNLKERCKIINADLTIESEINKGTTITIQF